MKNVFIVHGWQGSPNSDWFPWMKKQLESKGFSVIVPAMPNPDEPVIEKWVPFLSKQVDLLDENTFFIGHSIGCQTILRFLETVSIEKKVGGVILVAPWMNLKQSVFDEEEGTEEVAKPWIETLINWEKVKSHSNYFVCLFSDNDPYVPLSDIEIFKEKLGAKILIEHNKGHLNKVAGITELPMVLNELMRL